MRTDLVSRQRLINQLNAGVQRKLTLISAPAGFGKTTLIREWIAGCGLPVAWLSLDEGDSDPVRFVTYLVGALQTIKAGIGEGVLIMLHSHQQAQAEAILTTLLNEISSIPEHFLLILDDYHSLDSQAVDQYLTFLVEHQPPQMQLIIATREDPQIPLPRYRARGQLTELRAADLRFSPAEAADFLNRVMELNLTADDIAALETRTEGWIAGLQLAALSMQGQQDAPSFIQSFTGSHHFVLDYLVEEVLKKQSPSVQASCWAHLSSTACADLFVMPFYATHLFPARKPLSISNTPTCSSSPWIMNGTGTGIIICLRICCAGGWDRISPQRKSPNCIFAPANGMNRTV